MVFARDLLGVFDIRNPRALNDLIGLLADQTANRFEYVGLAKIVGLSVDALRDYLDYLEASFLIIRSEFWTKSRASRIRKQKKLYFHNVGLANGLRGTAGPQLFQEPEYSGRLVETLVADHCMRIQWALNLGESPRLFYWRNYRGQEVDIVLRISKRPVPVEVKYQTTITQADRRALLDFLTAHPTTPFGILVTKDTLGFRDKIVSIPLYLFLLMS